MDLPWQKSRYHPKCSFNKFSNMFQVHKVMQINGPERIRFWLCYQPYFFLFLKHVLMLIVQICRIPIYLTPLRQISIHQFKWHGIMLSTRTKYYSKRTPISRCDDGHLQSIKIFSLADIISSKLFSLINSAISNSYISTNRYWKCIYNIFKRQVSTIFQLLNKLKNFLPPLHRYSMYSSIQSTTTQTITYISMLNKKLSGSFNIAIKKPHSYNVYQHYLRSRKLGIRPIFVSNRKYVVVQKAVNRYNLHFHGFVLLFCFGKSKFRETKPFCLCEKFSLT